METRGKPKALLSVKLTYSQGVYNTSFAVHVAYVHYPNGWIGIIVEAIEICRITEPRTQELKAFILFL